MTNVYLFCNWLEFMNGTHVIPPKVYGKIKIFVLKIFLKRLWNRLDWVGLDRLQIFLDSRFFFSCSFSYLFSYYSFQKMWWTRDTPQKSLEPFFGISLIFDLFINEQNFVRTFSYLIDALHFLLFGWNSLWLEIRYFFA